MYVGEKVSFGEYTRDFTVDDIVFSGHMCGVDAHGVVEHESGLDASQ